MHAGFHSYCCSGALGVLPLASVTAVKKKKINKTHYVQIFHVVFGSGKHDSHLVFTDHFLQQVQQYGVLLCC
jgi:hypothetical protein